MAIGIVGNYGNDNQGDEAILEGILNQLEAAYHINRKEIVVFSNNPQQTHEKFGVRTERLYYKKRTAAGTFFATVQKNAPAIRKLDVLLIGGGGILMDLYLHGLIIFGMYNWLAKLNRTPTVVYGAGAGPIQTKFGKIILKNLANTAKLVMVRDENSQKLLHSIGVKNRIHIIADPAFYVEASQKNIKNIRPLSIGVTAVPYYHPTYWPHADKEKYNNYIQGMARNLDYLLKNHPKVKVQFFATKHPQDTAIAKEIKAQMQHQENCNVTDEELDQREIISFIQKQDIIIGTRLHSLILALVCNTPIMAVSYHRKVADFMHTIDSEDTAIAMEQIHNQDTYILHIYDDMNRDWNATCKTFEAKANRMKTKKPTGIDLLKQSFPLQ